MSQLTYRYCTLRTVVPKKTTASEEGRKVDQRSIDLTAIGEDGYDLVSTAFKRPEL